jgi:hypothetical protein
MAIDGIGLIAGWARRRHNLSFICRPHALFRQLRPLHPFLGHQRNDAKDLLAQLDGLLRRLIQEIRSILWRGVQEQEEETALQEEEMMG